MRQVSFTLEFVYPAVKWWDHIPRSDVPFVRTFVSRRGVESFELRKRHIELVVECFPSKRAIDPAGDHFCTALSSLGPLAFRNSLVFHSLTCKRGKEVQGLIQVKDMIPGLLFVD